MRKVIIVALTVFCTTLVNAQLTGGGNTNTNSNQPRAKVQNNDLIKNKKYLTFDIPVPYLGNFGRYYDLGLGFDFGFNKYLGIKLPEIMKIGIDYGFSLHTNGSTPSIYNFNSSYSYSNNYSDRLIFLSTRVGLVYTINVIDDLTVDAKFTLQPTLVPSINNSDLGKLFYGLRRGFGVYANYNMWRAGFQLSGGNLLDSDTYDQITNLNSGRLDISLGFKF